MSMARPSKPTANFRRVRAGPTMFLLFGRAYPDLTIAKDYGAHVLNPSVVFLLVIAGSFVEALLTLDSCHFALPPNPTVVEF